MPQVSLHEYVTCVAAPALWLSSPSGQLDGGVDGLYVADRRVLSRLVVTLDGVEPRPETSALRGAASARFTAQLGELAVERIRTVTPEGGTERIQVLNQGDTPVTATLRVEAAADLASVTAVKAEVFGEPAAAEDYAASSQEAADEAHAPLRNGSVHTASDGYQVALHGLTHADLRLAPNETFETTLTVRAVPPSDSGFRPQPVRVPPWSHAPLGVWSGDHRLNALMLQGIADLDALLLQDRGELFFAAGSPWYLTLFGRDALWSARMALPLGHQVAAGTLRALARYQGAHHELETEEEPGKIPHELRPDHAAHWLPAVYYGSVDATPLFVTTLVEAWRWGMPADEVEALLPAAERALEWITAFPEFVFYQGAPDKLRNQGWKDSGDAIQYADGRLAAPPVALSEVQAYSFEAATLGADLLEAFGRPGGPRLRQWASALAERFRERFWVDGYPAIALDGDGSPVDGPASNLGHLLGTGLLTPAEEDRVVPWLAGLDSGRGLRTLSDHNAGYDPLSYHCGSVWPHDTAIGILNLVRSGHAEVASRLTRGLIAAAPSFGYRLPELFGGQDATTDPVPYPAACRPQAWAAAVSPALVTALFGLQVDVPDARIAASPLPGFGARTVRNLRVGSALVTIDVDADGTTRITGVPPSFTVSV